MDYFGANLTISIWLLIGRVQTTWVK
ncbi:Bgt-51481 [Blumeria graminis f. sp. tritici]|uniref:Bgt-51481 n=1 Tax=Blumeria graminis f. sp. tritici TaxID=62690 RepID=A0A9X9MHW1_BLUGR|nr:Bgt-51481 [Blumeria graminis f. sp. tritici]